MKEAGAIGGAGKGTETFPDPSNAGEARDKAGERMHVSGRTVDDAAKVMAKAVPEIVENLCRAELTAAQRSSAVKRRAEIWTALHPAEQVGQIDPPVDVAKHGHAQSKSFAAETAQVSGQTKREINRHLSRANALGDDLEAVTGTSLDKGVELDALAKMPAAERRELIDKAKAGEKVTARGHDDHERNVRLARQAVAELDRCAKHMDDEEFVDALTGITLSVATKRMAAAGVARASFDPREANG